MLACDFFHVDTVGLKRLYVLFFIELDTRRVYLAGITSRPAAEWVTQQARNLTMVLAEENHPRIKFLIRDRDSKFTAAFDAVFAFDGVRVIRTPVRSPRANAFAERFVGTIRRECLDRILIFHCGQLERVLVEFIDHYNRHRPHRSLGQRAPRPAQLTVLPVSDPKAAQLRRDDKLGGLLHEYRLVA